MAAAVVLLAGVTGAMAAEPILLADNSQSYKKMSLEELMNQDVTSVSKQAEPLVRAAAAIQVVTSEDIRRSGVTSIPEALRLAGNLHVGQKNSHDWGITARGFNTDLANKLLVLIDGRTVYTPLFSGVFWSIQDYLLEDIDRIEVISGPGGTLWGANAVNGVINIITKSAKETPGLYVEAGGGSQLQAFTGVRYGGVLAPNVHFRMYGKYFDRDNELLAGGAGAPDSWRMGQGGFRVDAEPSMQNKYTVQGDFYRGTQNIPAGTSKLAGGNALGRWTHTFSEDSETSLQLYYDRTYFSNPVGPLVAGVVPLAPAGTLTDSLDTVDLDFQHRITVGERNKMVWGLAYRHTHDVVKNSPAIAFLPPTLDHDLFSGFFQDEIVLRENLSFMIGTKLEHNDYTGLEVEPSARLSWSPTSRQTVWAAVSRAVRTPSRVDRDLSQAGPPFFTSLRGDRGFESESLIAYELGHRAQLGANAVMSVSAYYNVYDDIRSTSTTPGTVFPFFFANNLEGETYGFELNVKYQVLDWWRLQGSYNLLKEDIRVKPGQADLNSARNETGDPQQQFALRSSMDLPGRVELDAGLRWVDVVKNNNSGAVGTVPSYFEVEVRLGWRATDNLELSIVGQNLVHRQHPEFGAPTAARGEIGRSVYGKISWRW